MKLNHFFKDADGRIVIFQWPNVPLWGWIVLEVLSLLLPKGSLRNGSQQLGRAFLFTWAYLELTKGVNYFRRLLGLIVLVALIVDLFR